MIGWVLVVFHDPRSGCFKANELRQQLSVAISALESIAPLPFHLRE